MKICCEIYKLHQIEMVPQMELPTRGNKCKDTGYPLYLLRVKDSKADSPKR